MNNNSELPPINNLDIFRGIKKAPEEANLALSKLFEVEIPNSQDPIHKLLIASESGDKQQILAEVMKPFGIDVMPPVNGEIISEEKYQELLEELKIPPSKYAARLSAYKLTNLMHAGRSGVPAIAFDTVVVRDSGEVLKKPTNIDEARETIIQLTMKKGNVVTVIDGVTFAMMFDQVTPLIWRSAAEISVLLKAVTQKQIDNYLDEQGDNVLKVAGGIDYASELGKKFIDDSANLSYIVGLSKTGQMQSLTDTVRTEQAHGFGGIRIANSAGSVLDPYFKGVPTHLVQGVIRNFTSKK